MNLDNRTNAQPAVQTVYTTPTGCLVTLRFGDSREDHAIRTSIAQALVQAAQRQKEEKQT